MTAVNKKEFAKKQTKKLILYYDETEEYDITEAIKWLDTYDTVYVRV